MDYEAIFNEVSDGKFFSVRFTKRTTGELRKMVCRVGVKKYLSGGQVKYNPRDKGLLSVWDVENKGYRSIPIDGVVSITVHGTTYKNIEK